MGAIEERMGEDEDEDAMIIVTETPKKPLLSKKRKLKEDLMKIDVDEALLEALKEKPAEDDECARFGKDVATFLRQFPIRKQIELKIKFQQLMLENMPEKENLA